MTALEYFVADNQLLSYLIIFAGMLIEADFFYVAGAIFAAQHHLNWSVLILVGFLSLILGDAVWYYIGKYSRDSRLGRWLLKRFRKYHNWLDQNFMPRYTQLIFFAKFIYYINRFFPFLAGWHRMETKKFFEIHLRAGLFWLVTMTSIGVFLGNLIRILGTRWFLTRIWLVAIFLVAIFIVGDYFLKRYLTKKIEANKNE